MLPAIKMMQTDKHTAYENECRHMFLGQTIRGVIYGELKYFEDGEGNNVDPEPYYKTQYTDIDTLDHSIYFNTDNRTIYVFWDNTFCCYGLLAKLLDLSETTNDYEQKWDVSQESKWKDLIGQRIIDFKILWEETWSSNLDGSNKVYTTYPQTFEIKTENGKTIIISACEFKQGTKHEIFSMMDNLLVMTNTELAKKLKIIE